MHIVTRHFKTLTNQTQGSVMTLRGTNEEIAKLNKLSNKQVPAPVNFENSLVRFGAQFDAALVIPAQLRRQGWKKSKEKKENKRRKK